jgi:TolB-like protein/DNA-binding winged helix-turn-helix (wHTH) protein/Tfp pilus assembly protein PilF
MRNDFRVGDWIVRPRNECIERGDECVHIHPKPMQVLQRLAAAGGEVVTRDELFESAWPGTVVSDDALTQCIVELRKAFGDSAREQRVIRTIPKVGFCLVQPVAEVAPASAIPARTWKLAPIGALALLIAFFMLYPFPWISRDDNSPLVAEEQASIAVLPFVNMSSVEEQDYISDGVTEELINMLARISGLRVISRTSAFSFKESKLGVESIARKLNVTHVLEGSVRTSGEKIRIAVQLIDARSDTPIWSQTYDRDLAEIISVQQEIAERVASEIEVNLLGDLPPSRPLDPEAYRLYLLGRYHLRAYDYPLAMAYLEQAVERAPGYAQAHLALASWYGGMTFFGNMAPREGYAKVSGELVLALGGDGTLANIYRPQGSMQFYFEWNWEAAEASMRSAIRAVPSDAHAHQLYAWYLVAMNRKDEAMTIIKRALQLEPLAPVVYLTASNVSFMAGRQDEAIEYCRSALELSPDQPLALSQTGWSYLRLGRFDDALRVMEKSVRLDPDHMQNLWMLGYAYAVAGQPDKAREVLEKMHRLAEHRYVMPFGFAMVHTGLNEKHVALDWLEKAFEERNGWMVFLNVDPRLDPLRHEPRFQALIEQMNYPD